MIDPTAEMPAVTETGLASMEKAVDQYETLQLRTLRMQERILATQDREFFVEHCEAFRCNPQLVKQTLDLK